jgi:hypothetical protein
MTSYHIQVSTDTLFFNKASIDTITSSTIDSLPPLSPLTKYYWRVAGVNSEGESRWSDVWNFTTGATTGVKENNFSSLSLSSFPNPSSKELNIIYTLPINESARIILYDLTGKIIREGICSIESGEHQIAWDISDLANGNYILGLITAAEKRSQIIVIAH